MRLTASLLLLCAMVPTAAAAGDATSIDVEFDSHDATLSGTIVLPSDGAPRAAVVFVHGSGPQTRNVKLAARFAQDGIAALVYDKRGVGESGGRYEGNQPVSGHNLDLLADDANAAMQALAAHPQLGGVPLGLTGVSQAGWIVPLAAQKSDLAQFIVLWSGPVCKVSEEDIFSIYTRDKDSDSRVPSYDEALSSRTDAYVWPDFNGRDTDSSEDLSKLDVPGLWLFGTNDGSVPVDLSIRKLKELKAQGGEYDYVLFSGLGHNNMPETIATAIDWIGRMAW